MAVCYVCGKSKVRGNRVSHAHNKSKRWSKPNLQKIKFSDKGTIKCTTVCTGCIKAGKVTKVV
ncbi:50S ribosomal protein L28 [bacterium BMS3Abin07]|nr:50S ribosomal protein L28 [bacterium BMS3Abin07]GBE32855.1 50S ribosomal protein L28 [bacterium BMS3Bbin05]HDO22397.1 50S ribosomal protein L28 [Nitrospirota bacterium]